MTRPLTRDKINDLRARALLRATTPPSHPALPSDQRPSKKRKEYDVDGRSSHDDLRQLLNDYVQLAEPMTLKRVKLTHSALSQSSPDDRSWCTTINQRPGLKRYTIMLWNVETYGESKAEANPYANVLIRHVLEELDVDLVLFLETQRFPSQVITAIEHTRRDELATVKERTKGPGIDINDRRRWNPREQADLAEDEEVRQDSERLKQLVEDLADWGEVRYFAFSSGVTGKMKALPPKIGAWLPPDQRPDVEDCVRFKRYYSLVSSRREPSWAEYLPDLLHVYDVRLRKVDADPDSTDIADFSPPLSDAEVKVLIDAVRVLTFAAPDLEYLIKRRQSMVVTDPEEWNAELNRILGYARRAGDEEVIRHFEDMKQRGPMAYGEQELDRIEQAAAAIRSHLERTREEHRALLQDLERSILLTLRTPETCRCGRPTAHVDQIPMPMDLSS